MNPFELNQQRVTRRQFFGRAASGLGSLALASLMGENSVASVADGTAGFPGLSHIAPRAKRVVCLWQGGAPSHVDLFDPKPLLQKLAGQDIPDSVRGDTRFSTMSSNNKRWPIVPAIKPYQRWGKCGTEISTMLPGIGSISDDICVVRSMNTEAVNHAPESPFS